MKYTLYKNRLTKDENDCIARPVNVRSRDIDSLIERVRGITSTLGSNEIKAVIDAYWSTIENFVADGDEYKDDHIGIRLGISGAFDDKWDRFDKNRHKVTINANVGNKIKGAVDKISMEYENTDADAPKILSIFDWNSKTEDQTLTPDGVIEIKGEHLKFMEDEEKQGVFFVNKANLEEAVKSDYIRINHPKQIQCTVPKLTPGIYYIEVRSASSSSANIKVNKKDIELSVS
ncbi:MAG: DNA-binding domain-containing protein [Hyphomicrobiales bacterium]